MDDAERIAYLEARLAEAGVEDADPDIAAAKQALAAVKARKEQGEDVAAELYEVKVALRGARLRWRKGEEAAGRRVPSVAPLRATVRLGGDG